MKHYLHLLTWQHPTFNEDIVDEKDQSDWVSDFYVFHQKPGGRLGDSRLVHSSTFDTGDNVSTLECLLFERYSGLILHPSWSPEEGDKLEKLFRSDDIEDVNLFLRACEELADKGALYEAAYLSRYGSLVMETKTLDVGGPSICEV